MQQPQAATSGIALPATSEIFRMAFEHAPIGIVLAHRDGTLWWVNHAACELLRRPAEELVGASYADIIHPDDLVADEANLEAVLASGRSSYTVERRCLRGDATVVPVQLDVSLALDDDGEPQVFVAHLQDLSEHRRTLSDLAEAHDALQASQARFAALVERSTDIICVVDRDGRLTYHSPAAERVLGFPTSGMLGFPFTDVVHPDDRGPLRESFEELLAHPTGTASAEVRVTNAAGEWRAVEIHATNRLSDPAVGGVVANVRDVTERVEAASRIEWQAFHDPLTGLPNRALLAARLGEAAAGRVQGRAAVLFLDLDRFKVVNDSLGHDRGDQLLVEVGRRLRDAVRPGDTVARLGGDEFVVLVEGLSSDDEALELAARIGRVVAEPIALDQGTVNTSTSIGIAFADPTDPDADLLRDADMALYRAKERGRNCVHVFTESLRDAALERIEVEHDLREALGSDRLVAHFQPIVDLATGDVVTAEALLRVRGADGRLSAPAAHLDVAEESGLIVPLGRAVLEQSCAALASWRERFGVGSPRRVAVNVAAFELSNPGFLDSIDDALARHGLRHSDLSLELTESTVISADDDVLAVVHRLDELGTVLAIDDFGTGYSSLAYLKRFPIGAVKLDRTFVSGLGSDPDDGEIVRAVVSLGEALGISVVAEGIETGIQLQQLQELGCAYGQGFALGRPAAPDELDLGAASAVIGATSAGWAVTGR